jgi:hypothetical protein
MLSCRRKMSFVFLRTREILRSLKIADNVFANRVARWSIFKPKIKIWVNFGGTQIEKCRDILWPFGIFYRHLGYHHLVHFVFIWYLFRFWYHVPRKIWQPCSRNKLNSTSQKKRRQLMEAKTLRWKIFESPSSRLEHNYSVFLSWLLIPGANLTKSRISTCNFVSFSLQQVRKYGPMARLGGRQFFVSYNSPAQFYWIDAGFFVVHIWCIGLEWDSDLAALTSPTDTYVRKYIRLCIAFTVRGGGLRQESSFILLIY